MNYSQSVLEQSLAQLGILGHEQLCSYTSIYSTYTGQSLFKGEKNKLLLVVVRVIGNQNIHPHTFSSMGARICDRFTNPLLSTKFPCIMALMVPEIIAHCRSTKNSAPSELT